MTAVISQYLDDVRNNLKLDIESEREVIRELRAHIEDSLDAMEAGGLSEDEAANSCIRLLGSAKLVARQIYEAHSQGTWKQAFLASLPHLMFALLFVLGWWHIVPGLLGALASVFIMAIYGWRHGKPTWLFPWLSYSSLPVMAVGLILAYLPSRWSWLALLVYVPLVLWWLYSVTAQGIKRDWLYSLLLLLPVPVIIGWFLAIWQGRELSGLSLERLDFLAATIGLSFLALGASVAMFVRLRQRWLKISVLFIAGLLTLCLVTYYIAGGFSLLAFILPVLITLGLFLTPALMERKIRHNS